jgi:hypothetical protein
MDYQVIWTDEAIADLRQLTATVFIRLLWHGARQEPDLR